MGCLFTPAFNVASINVEDGTNVTREEVLNKANIELNTNIFRLNLNKIKEDIETIPYIRSAKVSRVFPNEIGITYIECEKYSSIKFLESFVIMDKHSRILEIAKENENNNLPIIYGINSDNYIPGQILSEENKTKYDNIVYLIETMNQEKFEYNIKEVDYEDVGNVKITIKDMNIVVMYGKIERNIISEKINYLSKVLNEIESKEGVLDISSINYMEKTIFTEKY